MKLLNVKWFCMLALLCVKIPCVWAMDYTPPQHIPEYLKDKIAREDEHSTIDVRQHKRHSREHSTIDIHATITDAEGKETKLEVKKDGTLSTSVDSEEKKHKYSKSFVITTNCVSVACTALIGAGVTLAIKYGECPK